MEPFADAEDVEARWRPLADAEKTMASVLAADASATVRSHYPDIDARIGDGRLDRQLAVMTVAAMVKRAMIARDAAGVDSTQETAGPFSHQRTYTNPLGNLYLSRDEHARLAPRASRAAFTIDLTPGR